MRRWTAFLMFFAVACLTAAIYWQSLDFPFVFDDGPAITQNPEIRVNDLSFGELSRVMTNNPSNRVIAKLSFAVNYGFSRYEPRYYRVVNIAVHLICGVLCFWLATLLTAVDGRMSPSAGKIVGAAAAGLWLLHPLNSQPVLFVVQRMTSMATLFYLLTVCLYLYSRQHCFWVRIALALLALVSWGVSLGCKEIAVSCPVVILLCEVYFHPPSPRLRRYLIVGGVVAVGFLLVVTRIYLGGDPFAYIAADYAERDFTMVERVLTQFRVVVLYLSLFFFPTADRLCLIHDFSVSRSLIAPPITWVALLVLGAAAILAIRAYQRQRLLSFGIVWTAVCLLLESSIFPLAMVFEHRMYLPTVGLCIGIVSYVYPLLPRWSGVVLYSVVTISLSVLLNTRLPAWRSDIAVWRDGLAKNPTNARCHNNLGNALKQSDPEQAIVHYLRALELAGDDYMEGLNNIGTIRSDQGQHGEALVYFARAVKCSPLHPAFRYNLGNVLRHLHVWDEARFHYQEALRLQPGFVAAENGLASLTQVADVGISELDTLPEVWTTLGLLRCHAGHLDLGIRYLRRAVALDEQYGLAHNYLGIALTKVYQRDRQRDVLREAVTHLKTAVRLQPADVDVRANLNRAMSALNDLR